MSRARGRRARPGQHARSGARRRARPRPAGDPPNPVAEAGDEELCEIDGEPLFTSADAAAAAVDAAVATGRLVEEAVDDHDVRKHYADGPDLIDDFADKERKLPAEALPRLRALESPCTVRERCRLRRLRLIR